MAADPPASYDDLNVKSIALIGIVGAVLVFVSIVAVQVLFYRYETQEYDRKVIEAPTAAANEILAEQKRQLATRGEGAEAHETREPIDLAMASVVKRYREKQSQQESSSAASDSGRDSGASEPNTNK